MKSNQNLNSVTRILTSCLLMSIVCSCNEKEEKDTTSAFDSVVQNISGNGNLITGADSVKYDEFINSFSGKYNAISDWSKYGKNEKTSISKILVNRNAIVPVTREQIRNIEEAGFSDTSLVYKGERDNAFVFVTEAGEKIIRKLSADKSGLLLVRITGVTGAQKLYLEKKSTDFLHKEKKVTEFKITAELIDAVSISAPEDFLYERFRVK